MAVYKDCIEHAHLSVEDAKHVAESEVQGYIHDDKMRG
jgi:hypothetical protein